MKKLITLVFITNIAFSQQFYNTSYFPTTINDLKNFMSSVQPYYICVVSGQNTYNDGKGGIFTWDSGCTLTGNDLTVIRPTVYVNASVPGCWIKQLNNTLTLTSAINTTVTSLTTITNNSFYTAGNGISISSTTGIITNTSPDQTITLTGSNDISISGSYPSFNISQSLPTSSIVGRSLNSNFTISKTKNSTVYYSVTCSVTNPLLVGTSTATAFLEYSTNGGSNWTTVAQTGNSSGVGVTVTIAITNSQTTVLSGFIPANALTRIRTTTSGTGSVTYVTGQEILN